MLSTEITEYPKLKTLGFQEFLTSRKKKGFLKLIKNYNEQ